MIFCEQELDTSFYVYPIKKSLYYPEYIYIYCMFDTFPVENKCQIYHSLVLFVGVGTNLLMQVIKHVIMKFILKNKNKKGIFTWNQKESVQISGIHDKER